MTKLPSRSPTSFLLSRQIPRHQIKPFCPLPPTPKTNPTMAQQEEDPNPIAEIHKLEIPTRRVKNIMKLDKDINKVNSEALFLVASSTELFIQFLAEKSAHVALEKKKRTVRVEHMRVAAKRHRPTGDFLLDSLPMPPQPAEQNPPKDQAKTRLDKKPVPFATRSIEAFFQKFT